MTALPLFPFYDISTIIYSLRSSISLEWQCAVVDVQTRHSQRKCWSLPEQLPDVEMLSPVYRLKIARGFWVGNVALRRALLT